MVYAPSSVNQYGSSLFPGVSDAIFAAMEWGGSWDSVREQLDLVRVHMNYASQIMAQTSYHHRSNSNSATTGGDREL